MNNWDVRPTIVVAIGTDTLAPGLLDLAVKAIAKDEGMTGDITKESHNGTEYFLIASGGLQPDHIDTAMSCLYDHVANTDMDDTIGNLWGGCISDDHVQNDVECCGMSKDCIGVNVGSFDYYGPNCIVTVYYISE